MSVELRAEIMNAGELARALRRLAHQILEAHSDVGEIMLVGIREGGSPLAGALSQALGVVTGMPAGALAAIDVAAFRDDRPRSRGEQEPVIEYIEGRIHEIDRHVVILVDDVIQTGRTLRAALDALTSVGRPSAIESAVLIDRGSRELPLRPNYVGKNIPAAADDWVEVKLGQLGSSDEVGAFLVKR